MPRAYSTAWPLPRRSTPPHFRVGAFCFPSRNSAIFHNTHKLNVIPHVTRVCILLRVVPRQDHTDRNAFLQMCFPPTFSTPNPRRLTPPVPLPTSDVQEETQPLRGLRFAYPTPPTAGCPHLPLLALPKTALHASAALRSRPFRRIQERGQQRTSCRGFPNRVIVRGCCTTRSTGTWLRL